MLISIQEPTLFSGTIYQNVVDGLTGTPMVNLPEGEKQRMVVEACKSAYAHDFIETLPNVRSFLQCPSTLLTILRATILGLAREVRHYPEDKSSV